MTYLKWRLSEGTWGTGPEETIADRGGKASAGSYVDAAGYRIGYLKVAADLSDLDAWDVSEVTEAEALTFSQQFCAEAEVTADGHISSPPPPNLED
jgi:hypothetical protein